MPMQGGECSVAYLREMANKCRLLAGQLDERAAASLRKLAKEYEELRALSSSAMSFIGTSSRKG